MAIDIIGKLPTDGLAAIDQEIVTITSSAGLTASKILQTTAGGGPVKAVMLSNTHASAVLNYNLTGATALATHIPLTAGNSVIIVGLTNIQNLRMLAATATMIATYFR